MKVLPTLLFVLVLPLPTLAQSWQAGWARANITPEEPMWMAGYGSRDRPAEGKLTDLWAKALVLQSPTGQRAALITLDLVGIDRALAQAICTELQSRCRLSREQIAICVSHTHTGPVVGQNLAAMHYALVDEAQQRLIDQYADRLRSTIGSLVEKAQAPLTPVQLSFASGLTTFAVNRRNNAEAELPQLRAMGKLVGPVNHSVPVLAIRDEQGAIKVVVFGYACHSTVLDIYKWSGDYPGFAQIALEEMIPDAQAMFVAGCGGDQNPLPRRTPELAEHYGRQLADAVKQVVDAPMKTIDDHFVTRYREVPLAFGAVPTSEDLQKDATSTDRFVASRAKLLLAQVQRDGPLPSDYPYPIAQWELGRDGIDWIFLGGEVVVDYANRLQIERRGSRTWVTAYSNDVMAYIPSRRVLIEGRYEGADAMVYYGLPSPWSEDCEATIINAVMAFGASQ